MIDRLPRLYRLALLSTSIVVAVVSGAWIAVFAELAVAVTSGLLLGALAAALGALLLVHDFSPRREPIRVVRRH
jgi:hypothetical protein